MSDSSRRLYAGATGLLSVGLLACGVLVWTVFSCNDPPAQGLDDFPRIKVTEEAQGAALPKIDMLWVVDNSTSMCEEQENLSQNFKTFVTGFQETVGADVRIAVVTTDAGHKDANGRPDGGKFRTTYGAFESPCPPSRVQQCCTDQMMEDVPECQQIGPDTCAQLGQGFFPLALVR